MTKVRCSNCNGHGETPTGAIAGFNVAHTQWTGCDECLGTGVEFIHDCEHCLDSGLDPKKLDTCPHCQPTPEPTTAPAVTLGGVTVTAPGFTADRFERALMRALIDDLEVRRDPEGGFIVCHRGVNGGYRTTRHSCSCKAGEHGTPCKHRAMVCFHLSARVPAMRKAWAQARRERAGTAVAAYVMVATVTQLTETRIAEYQECQHQRLLDRAHDLQL